MAEQPEWLAGTTHKDWLLDGYAIDKRMLPIWSGLQWSKAWVDLGPSVAGNLGPYWHVPDAEDDCVHRLYPKVLTGKWLHVIRQACEEVRARCDSARLQAENSKLQVELATARINKAETLSALKRLLAKFEACARSAGNDAETIAGATEFARKVISRAEGGS